MLLWGDLFIFHSQGYTRRYFHVLTKYTKKSQTRAIYSGGYVFRGTGSHFRYWRIKRLHPQKTEKGGKSTKKGV